MYYNFFCGGRAFPFRNTFKQSTLTLHPSQMRHSSSGWQGHVSTFGILLPYPRFAVSISISGLSFLASPHALSELLNLQFQV